jgi:hypothetical protein
MYSDIWFVKEHYAITQLDQLQQHLFYTYFRMTGKTLAMHMHGVLSLVKMKLL